MLQTAKYVLVFLDKADEKAFFLNAYQQNRWHMNIRAHDIREQGIQEERDDR